MHQTVQPTASAPDLDAAYAHCREVVAARAKNFAYAFQWWILAIFAVVVYVRWLYVDAQRVGDDAAMAK